MDYIDAVNWGQKFHCECGWHHSTGWCYTLHKLEKASEWPVSIFAFWMWLNVTCCLFNTPAVMPFPHDGLYPVIVTQLKPFLPCFNFSEFHPPNRHYGLFLRSWIIHGPLDLQNTLISLHNCWPFICHEGEKGFWESHELWMPRASLPPGHVHFLVL